MFGTGHLVSPAVFHSSAAHFFPAFPSRLGSPQILIPGPLFSYELLRSYLQPEPCKQALLLASQASGHHADNIGKGIVTIGSHLNWAFVVLDFFFIRLKKLNYIYCLYVLCASMCVHTYIMYILCYICFINNIVILYIIYTFKAVYV